jgi:hypothetical protein
LRHAAQEQAKHENCRSKTGHESHTFTLWKRCLDCNDYATPDSVQAAQQAAGTPDFIAVLAGATGATSLFVPTPTILPITLEDIWGSSIILVRSTKMLTNEIDGFFRLARRE